MRIIICPTCKKKKPKPTGHVNRALKNGAPVYCGKKCAGVGRRKNISIEEKKRLKAEYDKIYSAKNRERIKKRNAEYHLRTYDPKKAANERKKRMPYHVEYCRRPEYRKWKREYDQKYVAKKQYGIYWESHLLLKQLFKEVDNRQVKQEQQLINKSQKRKRKWKSSMQKTSSKSFGRL